MSVSDGMADLAATGALQSDVVQKQRMDALRKSLSGAKTKDAKLREACQGFESLFISRLFKEMRATVPKDGLLHGHFEEQYYSMFDKALCDKLASDGGIGLADMMYRQLKGQVLGKDKGRAGKGDILPANRMAAAHAATSPATDRLPVSASGIPATPRLIPSQHFSPAVAVALARPGMPPLAPSHTPAVPPEDAALMDAAAQAAVPMAAPVSGEITSEYGWRSDPFKGGRAWHAGLDIAAHSGTPVSACWDGTVIFAGRKGGYGNMVEIEHPGGWISIYGHLEDYSVKSGDVVSAGGKIAEVGSTGRATGPHLHFELRRGGETVDPEQMLAVSGLFHKES